MTMIEKVAQAIFAARYPDMAWDRVGPVTQRAHIDMAVAALEAMRDPPLGPSYDTDNWLSDFQSWQRLVDAALQQKGNEG